MERFGQLVDKVARDLTSGTDWDATYSGCIGDIYQYAFSFEPQNGKEATIRAALHLTPSAKVPAGGAIVAARLALYATLVKAGASASAGAPSIDDSGARERIFALGGSGASRRMGRDRFFHSRPCPARKMARSAC